jgi:hypothetical protein
VVLWTDGQDEQEALTALSTYLENLNEAGIPLLSTEEAAVALNQAKIR